MDPVTCDVPDCPNKPKTRKLCGRHYERLRVHGNTDPPPKRGASAGRMVEVRTKKRPVKINTCGHPERKHYGRGLCQSCYTVDWMRRNPDANSGATWLKNHPEMAAVYKRRNALKKHGLTVEQYAALWLSQGGCCANSGCSFTAPLELPDHRKGLQVDHDHATGRRRRLLCASCNLALGCVSDSIERLLGLAEYLTTENALNPVIIAS